MLKMRYEMQQLLEIPKLKEKRTLLGKCRKIASLYERLRQNVSDLVTFATAVARLVCPDLFG